jgi:hypothetical protein
MATGCITEPSLANRVPLEVGDAALLRETMERDKSVIQEVVSLLH